MRALIGAALASSPALQAEIQGRAYANSSLGVGGVPASPQLPFVLMGTMPETPFLAVQETSRAALIVYQFYAYQDRGSYDTIDRILRTMRETLLGLIGQSADGVQCTNARWLFTSGELSDEGFAANMKYLEMEFVASQ